MPSPTFNRTRLCRGGWKVYDLLSLDFATATGGLPQVDSKVICDTMMSHQVECEVQHKLPQTWMQIAQSIYRQTAHLDTGGSIHQQIALG